MDIILTDSQFQRLHEIHIVSGQIKDEVYPEFINALINQFSEKRISKKIKDYFVEVVGIEDFKKKFGAEYLDRLNVGIESRDRLKKIFKHPDIISNLCFYLAKHFFKMKKGNDIYFIKLYSGGVEQFYFFDPELEEIVGRMNVSESGKTGQVVMSAVDVYSKGKGYGKKMYLTLLDIYKTLYSDTLLYMDSLNIWVNVLPKLVRDYGYVNVYNDKKTFKSVKDLDFSEIKRFYASK